jgi:hypothetical protein
VIAKGVGAEKQRYLRDSFGGAYAEGWLYSKAAMGEDVEIILQSKLTRRCRFPEPYLPARVERPTKLLLRAWPEVAAGPKADLVSGLGGIPEQRFVNSD